MINTNKIYEIEFVSKRELHVLVIERRSGFETIEMSEMPEMPEMRTQFFWAKLLKVFLRSRT